MKLLITGYGPFRNYKVNPSWEAVKSLQQVKDWIIVKECATVEYSFVSKYLPEWISNHQPNVIIHVGVGSPDVFKLETIAHNSEYTEPDVQNQVPLHGKCIDLETACSHLETQMDAECILEYCKSLGIQHIQVSNDAGRYLCEFILYRSLYQIIQVDHLNIPVIFIHVPSNWPQERINSYLQSIVTLICTKSVVRSKSWKSWIVKLWLSWRQK